MQEDIFKGVVYFLTLTRTSVAR